MRGVKLAFCVIVILGVFISCNRQSGKINTLLSRAEILVDELPDSSLILLDSIVNVGELNKQQYNRYSLVQIQAKDKCDKDISADTIILEVKDYYLGQDDMARTALSSFYCGRVFEEQGDNEKAMLAYLEAETYSTGTNDERLKGLIQYNIGDLYYKQMSYDLSIERYKDAIPYFQNTEKYKNEIISLYMIGNSFLLRHEDDSAHFYYEKALTLANQYKDAAEVVNVKKNMGVAFHKAGDVTNAKRYFREALSYTTDSLQQSKIYLNMGWIYAGQHEADSAVFYANKSLDLVKDRNENPLILGAYNLLVSIEKGNGNYEKALGYYDNFSMILNLFYKDREKQKLEEVKKKYDFEQLQAAANSRLLIERQWAMLFVLFLLLCIFVVIFLFYRKAMQNKKILLESEQKIYQLKDLAQNYDERQNKFRNMLYHHFDILKKAALLETYLREDERKQGEKLLKKFNEIVYGQENMNWDILYRSMNELQDGFFDQIRKEFTQLDDAEFRICCLSYADLSNTEIAIVMKQSINTIQTKKSTIRRKLGVKEYGNLIEFLNSNIKRKKL